MDIETFDKKLDEFLALEPGFDTYELTLDALKCSLEPVKLFPVIDVSENRSGTLHFLAGKFIVSEAGFQNTGHDQHGDLLLFFTLEQFRYLRAVIFETVKGLLADFIDTECGGVGITYILSPAGIVRLLEGKEIGLGGFFELPERISGLKYREPQLPDYLDKC